MEYKKDVVKQGMELFGSNFIPILEFIEINKYLKLLDDIDFVIFHAPLNHL